MKTVKRVTALLAALLIIIGSTALCFAASGPTDEILYYGITADVQDDATVRLTYHFKWKVLRDDIGKLEWVTIGIPNDNIDETVYSISDNIDGFYTNYNNGYYLDIYFKNSYKAGDVVDFYYTIVADYMYQMNKDTGITSYFYTPGWFDDIAVDELEIKWNTDKVDSIDTFGEPSLIKDGYYTINTSLNPGAVYTLRVNYPNDAYQFDADKYVAEWNSGDWGDDYDSDDAFETALGGLVFLAGIGAVIRAITRSAYKSGSGFADGKTETKITRTKIVYFDECPGCGAPREEGKTTCPYCGRDLVKSEEIIKEENISKEDKAALKYQKDGEYRYSSSPNTYVRVNVVHVPVAPRPSSARSSSGRSGRSGGGCAHSSCACACASCACACACACAGGGRAGCTTKDFYNTNLKLKQFELKKK